ncbi:MAG: apolipoprotein N-acyltransferase [Bacteroidetes bacterium]|nr:apolipoprotein N-acyltransferase [Bacteroidota bacterium]
MNKKTALWILTLLSPLLLFLAWPPHQMPYLMFVAFAPLLGLDQLLQDKGKTGVYFRYLYLSLFLFNLTTTWWVWNASPGGAVFMLIANSLIMTFPFMFYRFTRQILGLERALVAFILYWLGYEFLHYRWDLAYPWLVLGNSFATSTSIIQWYEYTGVLGGSLWILLANVLLFYWVVNHNTGTAYRLAGLLLLPIGISHLLLIRQELRESYLSHKIVVVQPNIDPYNKFNSGEEMNQMKIFISLAEQQIDSTTEYVVLPETAIVENLDESNWNSYTSIRMLRELCERHSGLKIITGASTYKFYSSGEELSVTARHYEPTNQYYDSYNTALFINENGVEQAYHKSRLVPGVEMMPYPGFFKILAPLAIDMGGISGSLGSDKESKILDSSMATTICYESIFGEYVGSFVRKGAGTILVITNDGWWGNTPGYRQHLHYGRLRAIENRRSVVRAANTGISCVINNTGEIITHTEWWEPKAFSYDVPEFSGLTFYATHGDYIGRIAIFISVFLLLSLIVKRIVNDRI